MSTTTTGYEHITVREDGVAVINGARTKIAQLVSEVMAYGWSPEELHFQHPHLSMSQIHSALGYYWEHREEIEHQIEADLKYADEMRQRAGESPLAARLKAKRLL
jgi:uncharacterized protein (DUF433 family)